MATPLAALEAAAAHAGTGFDYPVVAALPFGLLLAAIAVTPLLAPRWWHNDRNRAIVAGLTAAPIALLLIAVDPHALYGALHEYLAFVLLLGALYTISGGIVLTGDLQATPRANTAFLASGAILANVFGTTGASMLLIRPLLRTNSERRNVAHVPLFFILIVSNCGGMLTPLGDPPLFLGYLRGVPFLWTLTLLPVWLLFNGYLLVLFFACDTFAYRREAKGALRLDRTQVEPLRLRGLPNLALLAIAAASAALPSPWRETLMLVCAITSYVTTPASAHRHNHFSLGPMREVAILFGGIFVTMVPALALLRAHAGSLGLSSPRQFFWVTGILSSVLDNAPTYLTFLSVAQGIPAQAPPVGAAGVPHALLAAISAAAVVMGANTYIGNGPNFMVRAIAVERGLPMPSFGGYAVKAFLILLPAYLAATLIWF